MANNYSYFPLTYSQKNIYKTEITYPGTSIGTIAATLRIIDENLNLDYIEKALNLVIEHNDVMRCRIKIVAREPRQYFTDYEYIKFDRYDFTGKPRQALFEYDEEQTKIPFALIDSPLFYFSLIKLSDTECGIYSKVHHIINDAWAIVRVGNLVLEYYDKMSKGIEIELDNIPSYVEYIGDELSYLASDRLAVDREFWAQKLESPPNSIILKPRKSKFTDLKSKRKTFLLPEKLSAQLRQYCRDTKTSLFAVILSAFAIYIKRTMHKGNMVIGTPVLNRSNRRQKNTLGMFISTVPLFIDLQEDDNFTEFNKKLTREWMSVLKHQRYPFEFILKEARERYKEVKDLFDVVFSYQNASFTENQSSARHRSRWHFIGTQLESLSIHINDREGEGILIIDYDFLENMFFEKEIDFLHDNFIRVLWHALDDPLRQMSKLELISEEEKGRILNDFNSNVVDVPENRTIVELFNAQAEETPDKIALVHAKRNVTYSELDAMANSLANLLIKKGLKREDIVALMMDKSVEMIVAILAILKAGGAYLAIEKDFPMERKRFILKDSGARFFITENPCREAKEFKGINIFSNQQDLGLDTFDPGTDIKAADLAYINYTSGTTGQPKGVMIEHKSVVNYVYAFLDEFKYDGSEKVLEQSSYSFDAFVEEVFPTLSSGSTLVIGSKYGAKDMKKLEETIRKHDVSVVSVSPLVLNELNKMDKFESVKTFISGGDVLKYDYYSNLIKSADVYNTYGPTEATVCATYHKCDAVIKESIPIGKPIANYSLYILDGNLNLLPIGAQGELYISGPGLSRGYTGRPELTAESFIDNPFRPGEKMYKTRDIARWYPMGEIDYLGRSDRQVKIRGVRIELGEIESELVKHDKIKAAVVTDQALEDGRKKLCVYYVKTGQLSVKEIRDYLRSKLPSYMIPSYFLEMDKIPLSATGKVNTEALPEIECMILNEENEYIAPTNDIEKKLTGLVGKLLKVNKVGTNDNYFELGGDSLDLTALAYDIADEFNVDIPLEKLFKADTIKEIADTISVSSPKTEGSAVYNDNIFLMHEGEADNNIFFIHDGIGGIGAYFDLCNEFYDYNIWGIRSNIPATTEPRNITVEELAEYYAKQITGVADEPYTIGGWCIGGTIAFEVVRQLQIMGKSTNTLFLLDTIEPKDWHNEIRFSLEGEKDFIRDKINYYKPDVTDSKADSLKELWDKTVEEIEHSISREEIVEEFLSKVPEDIEHYLDDYHDSPCRDIFSFINLVRTFHIARAFYFPAEKIKSDICVIQAKDSSLVKDHTVWRKYTDGAVFLCEVEGNHYSMLKPPGAKEVAETMKKHIMFSEAVYAKV